MTSKSLTEAIYETVQDFHKVGVVSHQTMREFDELCLPKIKKYSARQIQLLRQHNHVSQAVFAAYLNTTSSTIQKWEQGQKKPSRFALKLLSLVDKFGIGVLAA